MKTTSAIRFIALAAVLLASANVVGANMFAHFVVKNGESFTEKGLIMNAEVVRGKWQVHGRDVDTVNDMPFDQIKAATFTASGFEFANAGTEGFFEIHENRKIVAIVYFNVPFNDDNTLEIKQVDKRFLCNHKGFSSDGSPTIQITCHKIASGGA